MSRHVVRSSLFYALRSVISASAMTTTVALLGACDIEINTDPQPTPDAGTVDTDAGNNPRPDAGNNNDDDDILCSTGFEAKDGECVDIDECETGDFRCPADQVCENRRGGFNCVDSPASCSQEDFCDALCLDNPNGDDVCTSSVRDPESPFYTNSCDLSQFYENPTDLFADCRCSNHTNREGPLFAFCKAPSESPPSVKFGNGPSVREVPNSRYNGGFFDADSRSLYVGAQWSDAVNQKQGTIYKINVDTGDRVIISGHHNSLQDGYFSVGSGPTLNTVLDVQRGPDGFLYAYSNDAGVQATITRIDEATGERTTIWSEFDDNGTQQRPSNQCANGVPSNQAGTKTIQIETNTWAMDSNGNHYFGVQPNGAPRAPNGVVQISADGNTCTWITRFAAQAGNEFAGQDIGSGPTNLQFNFQGMMVHPVDGLLYARSGDALVSINTTTGQRRIVSNASLNQTLGAGAGMGDRFLVYDDLRDLIWTAGTPVGTTVTAVNTGTFNRKGMVCTDFGNTFGGAADESFDIGCIRGSGNAQPMTRGGIFVDPAGDHDLLIVHDTMGIVRIEVDTGNSLIISL